ncbi:hypothetical protein EV426DRAFT_717717 [Tirmania nivea]|nr:hypothetical protein EV426DRAFT_717717 [Tirmania nivea]
MPHRPDMATISRNIRAPKNKEKSKKGKKISRQELMPKNPELYILGLPDVRELPHIIAAIGVGIPNLSNSGSICPRFKLRTYWFPTKKEQTAHVHNARKSLYPLPPESLSQFWPPHKLYTHMPLIWRDPPKSSYTKRIFVAGGDREGEGEARIILSSQALHSLKVSSLFRCKKAVVNYTRFRSGKGGFAVWKQTLGEGDGDVSCRICGRYDETGHHVALVCGEGEWLGRRFGSWEDIDSLKLVLRKEEVDGKTVTVDLAETFFGRLRSY